VPYAPGYAAGLRWNDPALGIRWPLMPTVISPRDAEYPLLDPPSLRNPPPAL
jgi:dTDP-4-dehydrorhamnose 3,5-epimerase